MKFQGLFEERRFLYVAALLTGFSLILLGINLYMFLKNEAPANVNNIANVISISVATIFAIRLWFSNRSDNFLNRFWGLMTLGIAFWAIAECIWLYLSLVSSEVPYPSAADFFWVLGYIPVTIAFIRRRAGYQIVQTPLQRMVNILVVTLFLIVVGVFVIWPTVIAFDSTKIIESVLNVVYPLNDVILLSLILGIFFSTQTGRFSITWRLLGFGFLVMTISDLMFSYTSWFGIYFPDDQPNIISIVLDVLYYNSYLLMAIGMFAFGLVLEMERGIRMRSGSTALTRSSILLFVDKNLQIISFSDNFLWLVNDRNKRKYLKLPLNQALRIDTVIVDAIKSYAITHGFVSNQALKVKCADDSLRDVWLTAVAVFDPENENQFTNLAIVLRANLPEKAGEEAPLTSEQERLTEYYLSKAGTHAKEEKEIIQDYYLEQIRLLYSIIHQFSGVKIADGLMEHLDQIAKNKGWQVSREEQEIAMPKENDVRSLVEATSTLLGAARQYAVGASSAGIVNEEIRRMDQDIKPEALRSLDQFGLRQLQVPA